MDWIGVIQDRRPSRQNCWRREVNDAYYITLANGRAIIIHADDEISAIQIVEYRGGKVASISRLPYPFCSLTHICSRPENLGRCMSDPVCND